jgi:hypothetical protein
MHRSRLTNTVEFVAAQFKQLKRSAAGGGGVETVGHQITVENIIAVTTEIMKLTEELPRLKGVEKRETVLGALKLLCTELELGTDDQLMNIIETVIPGTIDMLIFVDKSGLFPALEIKQCCGFW